MRIALVGPYPEREGRFGGGVESAFATLVKGLALFSDLDLHIVTFVAGGTEPRTVDNGTATVHYVPSPLHLNNLTLHRTQRRRLRALLDGVGPDLVHAQDALRYGYVCLRAVRDVPVVVSVHGIVREQRKLLETRFARLQASLAGTSMERYCVRHAPFVLQPTTYPQEYFGSELRGEVVDVGNGIDDVFFRAAPRAEPGRVLYAGHVAKPKRVLDLVEALALVRESVPDATLRVAGAARRPDYLERLRVRVQQLGVGGAVVFLGQLGPEQMVDEYRRAAVFALPSAQETSPMVIGEAMAVGVPVVATDVGGVPYLVDDGRTGYLVRVGNVAGLANRLRELLLDETVRATFAAAARDEAERRFRVADVAARVRSVYERALRSAAVRAT